MTITWQDNVTPLDATNMNKLEQTARKATANGYASLGADGLVPAAQLPAAVDVTGKVDKDSVVVAATRIVASKLLAGDAQPAFFLGGDGKLQWGTGGAAALDTNLYRTAPGQLKTDGTLRVTQGISANFGSSGQIHLDPTGRLYFGNALDTYLYRSAANVLKTDGSLYAGAAVAANIGTGGQLVLTTSHGGLPTLDFGSGDVLYRLAAGYLRTDGGLAAKDIYAWYGLAQQVYLGSIGGNAGAYFGSANDTNLYRAAAGYLRTDGGMQAGSLYALTGSIYAPDAGRLYFGSALDTSLYRSGAGIVKTDGNLVADQNIVARFSTPAAQTGIGNYGPSGQAGALFGTDVNLYRASATVLKTDGNLDTMGAVRMAQDNVSKLWFGSAFDTNLYRSSGGTLKTDGSLIAAGNISSLLASGDAQPQIVLSRNYAGTGLPGIAFGPGGATGTDTSLYRSAASELTTPGFLYANGGLGAKSGSLYLQSDGGKIFLGTASDVNLYRFGANYLKSDSNLLCGATVAVDHNNAGGKLYFGSGTDASLYRSAANTLETAGTLNVGALGINVPGVGGRSVEFGGPDSAGAGYRSMRVSN